MGAKGGQDTPTSEWIVAALSALLVLAAIGYLSYDALTAPALPPDVEIRVDSVVRGRANYIVRFRAENLGGSTASALQVVGELLRDSVAVETSHATVDFVPARSERRGGLYFTRDPGRYRLRVRAEGYTRP